MLIFPFAHFVWLCFQYFCKRVFFCLGSGLVRARPCWFALCSRRAEKNWLVTYLILWPHRPALFMTSLIQVAENKPAALTVVLSRHSNVDFFHIQDYKSCEELLRVYPPPPRTPPHFLSTGSVILVHVGLPLIRLWAIALRELN